MNLSKKQLKDINEGLKIKEPSLMDKSSCNELISDLNGIINKLTLEENKYNEILRCISDKNRENISEDLNFLYPLLDDQKFNKKISLKKEFSLMLNMYQKNQKSMKTLKNWQIKYAKEKNLNYRLIKNL